MKFEWKSVFNLNDGDDLVSRKEAESKLNIAYALVLVLNLLLWTVIIFK